jgi:polyphenol oxidase
MAELTLNEPFYAIAEQIGVDLPGARAIFTTRRGGHSKPPFDTLNLGRLTDDSRAAVNANRGWLEARFKVKLAYGRQVHGTHVRIVTEPTPEGAEAIDGDGVVTATAGLGALVLSADCLPVVIAGGGALACVHAGWKGLYGGVIAEGVSALRAIANDPDARLQAAIGPAAGVCCYEVSEELHERFSGYPGYAREGRNLNLKSIAREQLHAAGVETVDDVDLCTICDHDGWLFSHRRDSGITGRQGAVAWLT